MPETHKPDPDTDSVKQAWREHNLEHFRYFRSLNLRTKLEAIQGMADVVRRFQELRAKRNSQNATKCETTMNNGIQNEIYSHRTEIAEFCKRHGVRRLEVFGSSLHTESPHDMDFLVDLGERSASDYAATYFTLLEYLQDLFKRPVDLVTPAGLENPYFRQRVEQEKALLYAA